MDELLDSRQLRAFLALARTGSFTAAAKQLHLTQSAISHAIKVLEETLGCTLVHRNARQVLFTRHGRELLHHAEGIEHRMKQALEALRSLDGCPRGTLRIGCTTAASQFLLPGVLREFKESFPHYDIKVLPGESPAVLDRMMRDEVDIGLIIQPEDHAGIEVQPVFEDEIHFVVAPGHPWAAAESGGFRGGESFIISTRESYTWRLISEALRQHGMMPQSLVEVGSSEAIKALALTGYGVGVCAGWAVAGELASGRFISIEPPGGRIRRRWVGAILKDRAMNLAERTFLGLCRENGRLLISRAGHALPL
jgi:DNA-binding transcriptional LysR family regulator